MLYRASWNTLFCLAAAPRDYTVGKVIGVSLGAPPVNSGLLALRNMATKVSNTGAYRANHTIYDPLNVKLYIPRCNLSLKRIVKTTAHAICKK